MASQDPETGDQEEPASMNRIDALFARLKSEGRHALMPFITAGDPDLPTTAALITEMVARGRTWSRSASPTPTRSPTGR